MNNLGNNNHQVYKGNCFDVMDYLIENKIKVDAIICDMPFGVTNNKGDKKLDLEKVGNCISKIKKNVLTPIVLFADKKEFETELYLSKKEGYRYEGIGNKDIATAFLDVAYKPMMVIEKIMVFIEKAFFNGVK